MLCLGRKSDESIIVEIPPSPETQVVRIVICDVGRGQVRVGLEADKVVRIVREEIRDKFDHRQAQ